MVKASVAILCAVAFALAAPVARGNTMLVNGFGVGGWSSWEMINSSGTLLIGSVDSSASAAAYFHSTASSGSDTAIQKQIIFMDSGQSAKAAGGSPTLTGPSGSLNNEGYVRLDAGSGSSGKSDLSYVDFNGIAAASVLDGADFAMDYRYYLQPYNSIQPLGLNITIRGTDGADYTLTHFDSGVTSGWMSSALTSTSGGFGVTKKGTGTLPGGIKSLDAWFHDSTFGGTLFGSTAEVVRVGFTVGIGEGNVAEYVDWVQTPLLNGGDMIDFVGPSTVVSSGTGDVTAAPLPSAAGMGVAFLTMAGGGMMLRRKWAGVARC